MTGLFAAIPAILMLAVFALVAGGVWMIVKKRDRTKGMLMLVAAVVFFGNVLIMTV